MNNNYAISDNNKEKLVALELDIAKIKQDIEKIKLEIKELNIENLHNIATSWLDSRTMKQVQLKKRRMLLNKRQLFNLTRRMNNREENLKDILIQEIEEKSNNELEVEEIQNIRELLELQYTMKDIEIEFAIVAIQMQITEGEKQLGIFPELMLKAEKLNYTTKMEEATNSKRAIAKEIEQKNKILNCNNFEEYLEEFIEKNLNLNWKPIQEKNIQEEVKQEEIIEVVETKEQELELVIRKVSFCKKAVSFIKGLLKRRKKEGGAESYMDR